MFLLLVPKSELIHCWRNKDSGEGILNLEEEGREGRRERKKLEPTNAGQSLDCTSKLDLTFLGDSRDI